MKGGSDFFWHRGMIVAVTRVQSALKVKVSFLYETIKTTVRFFICRDLGASNSL